MLKKIYRIVILPYTFTLLYLMLIGFGREPYSSHLMRLYPFVSTIEWVQNSSLQHIFINLLGNIILFIPFGFLGWIKNSFNNYKTLIFRFIFGIFIIESIQYLSRMGVFDIDDILLNSLGASIGFLLKNKIEKQQNVP